MRLQLEMLKAGRILKTGSIALSSFRFDIALPLAAYMLTLVHTYGVTLCAAVCIQSGRSPD